MPTRIQKDVFFPFAVSSPAEGRSKPVPKTRNGCFHQQWVTLVNGPVHDLFVRFFGLGISKIEVTSHSLSDQSHAGVYRGKHHIPPILGHFGLIRIPYPKGLNCSFDPL